MMFRKFIPSTIYKVLWGNRQKFGFVPDGNDTDWILWQEKAYRDFYQNTQQRGIGNRVNSMAYPIIQHIDFSGKRVLEVGPGIIRHLPYIKNKPAGYTVCDINEWVLGMAEKQLKDAAIPCETVLLSSRSNENLPFTDKSFDIIICFNTLEHLYPLGGYLSEFSRILKKEGQFIGGIPCEGGLAWGLSRFFTTRRYVHKNYKIDYDKIISWEHPNFVDFIINELDTHFQRKYLRLHPFSFLPIDFNLIASFIYSKRF